MGILMLSCPGSVALDSFRWHTRKTCSGHLSSYCFRLPHVVFLQKLCGEGGKVCPTHIPIPYLWRKRAPVKMPWFEYSCHEYKISCREVLINLCSIMLAPCRRLDLGDRVSFAPPQEHLLPRYLSAPHCFFLPLSSFPPSLLAYGVLLASLVPFSRLLSRVSAAARCSVEDPRG